MIPLTLSRTTVCACVLAALAGGAFGTWRAATGLRATVVDWDRLRQASAPGLGPVRWIDSHATLELVAPDWRPLAVRLDVAVEADAAATGHANDGTAGPSGPIVRIEADGWVIGELRPRPGRSTAVYALRGPPERREKLQLRLLHRGGPRVALLNLEVTPFLTWSGVIRHALAGVLTGIAFGIVWLVVRLPRPIEASAVLAGPGLRRAAVVCGAVAAYLAFWGGLKPVLQAPDEPQHLMKANAVVRQPWLTAGTTFDHAPRFVNPLPLRTPPELDRIFFRGDRSLSAADIDTIKRMPWPSFAWGPSREPHRVALASYPTVYYAAAFALAEPIVAATHATPYQAVFVYRLVTILLAALAWTLVYAELWRTPELRPHATLVFAFLLANPMLAFVTASVNADALSIPLCIGGALAAWRVLATGAGSYRALCWLVPAALVKPAGLQMMVAIGVASAVTWAWWRRLHVVPAAITVARGLAISYALFYAWSYIHLYAGGPIRHGVVTYAGLSVRTIGDVWVMYWGQLGWLDYTAPVLFYAAIFVALLWAVAAAYRQPQLSRPAQVYLAVTFLAFAATMYVVEYSYLREAGYIIQGRYFLPASIGLAPLLLHRSAPARVALVATVVLLNVLLAGATVRRYYGGDWQLAWQALPFDAPHPSPFGATARPAVTTPGAVQ
jgi:hypothetical protein